MRPWKASTVYFWEEAPFFRLLLPLIAAIVCYEYNWLPIVHEHLLLLVLLVVISLTVIFSFLESSGNILKLLKIIFINGSFFLLGWFLCFLNNIQNDPSWFGKEIKTAEVFEAKILEVPLEKERTWKLKVSVIKALRGDNIIPTKGEALVYVYKNDSLLSVQQGDIVLIPNKWVPIKNPGNPFEFDNARFAKRQNIFYQQFLSVNDIQKIYSISSNFSLVQRCHIWSMQQLERYVKDKQTLGLLQAMLLGDEINFDSEQRQLYVDTGIIHVVAISGGHVMFLFWIISLCFFWLKNEKYKWIKYLVALPLVWFYVMMAGAPSSAIRAAVMFSFLSVGFSFQKSSNSLNLLFATAFIILVSKPLWLFAVGFQLSFVAVLSLIIFYKRIYQLWVPGNFILRRIWMILVASLSAELLVAPLVVYYFHLLPITFLFANIVAWLLMGIVMIAGIGIIFLSKLNVIAHIIATIATYLTFGFNYLLKWLQWLNPASFKFLYLTTVELCLWYIIIIGITTFLIRKYKAGIFISLIATCLLLLSFNIGQWNALQQRIFIAYNINRAGYAELIENNKHVSLIVDDVTSDNKINFATKEMHIVSRAWKEMQLMNNDILTIGKENLLILKEPITIDTSRKIPVDYLLINYPVDEFNAHQLQQLFHFKKVILTGNQKRYIAEKWKDSCLKYSINAHFTMFDGAFILK